MKKSVFIKRPAYAWHPFTVLPPRGIDIVTIRDLAAYSIFSQFVGSDYSASGMYWCPWPRKPSIVGDWGWADVFDVPRDGSLHFVAFRSSRGNKLCVELGTCSLDARFDEVRAQSGAWPLYCMPLPPLPTEKPRIRIPAGRTVA